MRCSKRCAHALARSTSWSPVAALLRNSSRRLIPSRICVRSSTPLRPACARSVGSSCEGGTVAMTACVPALLISAPASGQGKTTVVAALARHAARSGRRVRVFKTGPDFIDPMILARAAGQPVYQLDLWMGGSSHCRDLLYQAARQADLVLVEGVM